MRRWRLANGARVEDSDDGSDEGQTQVMATRRPAKSVGAKSVHKSATSTPAQPARSTNQMFQLLRDRQQRQM